MAPSRAKPYRVTFDDAERNRKFPAFAMPRHRAEGQRQSDRNAPLPPQHRMLIQHVFADRNGLNSAKQDPRRLKVARL
jgi:hypothetical protein